MLFARIFSIKKNLDFTEYTYSKRIKQFTEFHKIYSKTTYFWKKLKILEDPPNL